VEKDTDYIYALRAIRQVRETAVESEVSAEVAINTTDHTPPRVPTGLVAVPTTTGMVLKWDENGEEDLAGYNLYRRAEGEAGAVKLNGAPLVRGGYTDATAVKNKTYTYTVTALDDATNPNESRPSEGITITCTF
jgi:fibronectin type 3 domain-containing protein